MLEAGEAPTAPLGPRASNPALLYQVSSHSPPLHTQTPNFGKDFYYPRRDTWTVWWWWVPLDWAKTASGVVAGAAFKEKRGNLY